jgi:hypothetical protein
MLSFHQFITEGEKWDAAKKALKVHGRNLDRHIDNQFYHGNPKLRKIKYFGKEAAKFAGITAAGAVMGSTVGMPGVGAALGATAATVSAAKGHLRRFKNEYNYIRKAQQRPPQPAPQPTPVQEPVKTPKTWGEHILNTTHSKTLKRIKNPIQLLHGSKSALSSLHLPKTYDAGRSADGHAVYLTTHHEEAERYGDHVHKVNFHVNKKHLIDMDLSVHEQTPYVKSRLKKLVPEVFQHRHKIPKVHGCTGCSLSVHAGLDAYHHLAHKLGSPEAASKALAKAGIPGGFGESQVGGNRQKRIKPTLTTVYSSYEPHKHVEVVSHSKVRPYKHLRRINK